MPSFDIASKVDLQTLGNAINTVKKELQGRFDFRDSHVAIDLNKKDFVVNVEVESDMKMKQVIDVIISRSMKQGIDANAFDFSKDAYPSGKVVKKEIQVGFIALNKQGEYGGYCVQKGFSYAVCYADDKNFLEPGKHIL